MEAFFNLLLGPLVASHRDIETAAIRGNFTYLTQTLLERIDFALVITFLPFFETFDKLFSRPAHLCRRASIGTRAARDWSVTTEELLKPSLVFCTKLPNGCTQEHRMNCSENLSTARLKFISNDHLGEFFLPREIRL